MLAERHDVRLVPQQTFGTLLLLLRDNDTASSALLLWGPHEEIVALQLALEKGSRDIAIPTSVLRIDARNIASVVADVPSATMLITLREPVDGQTSLLFHPIDAPDFSNALQPFIVPAAQSASSSQEAIDETLFATLSGFSRVTTFYNNVARSIVGAEDTSRRPRSTSPSATVNPWIVDRPLDLPPSRRGFGKRNIAALESNTVFRTLLFTTGSTDDNRVECWRRLFGTSDDFDYQKLVESISVPADCTSRIEKDVVRTDRTVDYYHPDITTPEEDLCRSGLAALRRILTVYAAEFPEVSYVQGMNDIASSILYALRDESLAYQVFRAVMNRQKEYFSEHGDHTRRQLTTLTAMLQVADPLLHDRLGFNQENAQLFFCYRWLLLLFKREFGITHFPLILETIFASPTQSYELFIALALLLAYRGELLQFGSHFDQTLQFYSERAGTHNVDAILDLADSLHQLFTLSSPIRADPRLQTCLAPVETGDTTCAPHPTS